MTTLQSSSILRIMEKVPLESGIEEIHEGKIEKLPKPDVVVVLGGGIKRKRISQPGEQGKFREVDVLAADSKMRLLGLLELHNKGLADKIILAGGIFKKGQGTPVAELMKDYLIKRGVPAENIITEDQSKNTRENLINVLEILKKEKLKNALLETSEFHLGRATQTLENILEKEGLITEYKEFSGLNINGMDFTPMAAEELVKERSPHHKKLTKQFTFPEALNPKNPKVAIKAVEVGSREFLRRLMIYIDPEEKIARFLVNILRK